MTIDLASYVDGSHDEQRFPLQHATMGKAVRLPRDALLDGEVLVQNEAIGVNFIDVFHCGKERTTSHSCGQDGVHAATKRIRGKPDRRVHFSNAC